MTFWVGVSLNRKRMRGAEARGSLRRTGREVILDTDFAVVGTYREWDREAARRISKILRGESIEVGRL
jgi:hypothetical protein